MRQPSLRLAVAFVVVVGLAAGCPAPEGDFSANDPSGKRRDPVAVDDAAPGKRAIQPLVEPEQAPAASKRADGLPSVDKLTKGVESYFAGHVGHRVYLQVDKPLYKPGETVWFGVWDLSVRGLDGAAARAGTNRVQLIGPKGAVVLEKRLQSEGGSATNDFEIPAEVQGGAAADGRGA